MDYDGKSRYGQLISGSQSRVRIWHNPILKNIPESLGRVHRKVGLDGYITVIMTLCTYTKEAIYSK